MTDGQETKVTITLNSTAASNVEHWIWQLNVIVECKVYPGVHTRLSWTTVLVVFSPQSLIGCWIERDGLGVLHWHSIMLTSAHLKMVLALVLKAETNPIPFSRRLDYLGVTFLIINNNQGWDFVYCEISWKLACWPGFQTQNFRLQCCHSEDLKTLCITRRWTVHVPVMVWVSVGLLDKSWDFTVFRHVLF